MRFGMNGVEYNEAASSNERHEAIERISASDKVNIHP